MDLPQIICDGCGQAASAEHVARRLRRLEWATRHRPLHVQTLLLGAVAPAADPEFVYADPDEFGGEAEQVLRVAGVAPAGKTAEAIHHELQRLGIFVAHVLECKLEDAPRNAASVARTGGDVAAAELLAQRVGKTLTRIRRSIKPKRVAPMGAGMDSLLWNLTPEALGCEVILDRGRAFHLEAGNEVVERLRNALARPPAALG
jgi:hypothetical protein